MCKICPADNTVVLGPSEALFRRDAAAADVNWISGHAPDGPIRCCAKVRYRQTEQPATVTPRPDGGADILFDEPQRAITPGQAAVFYDGDVETILFFLYKEKEKTGGAKKLPQSARSADSPLLVEGA